MAEVQRDHFFDGVILGGILGLAAGLMTAPKRGEEMRGELAEKANQGLRQANDQWSEVKGKMTDRWQDLSKNADELKDVLSTKADKLKENITDVKDALRREASSIRERIASAAEQAKESKEREDFKDVS